MKKFIRMHVTYDLPMEFVTEEDAEICFIDVCGANSDDKFEFFESSPDKIPVAIDVVYMGDEDDISE